MSLDLQVFVVCMMLITLRYTSFRIRDDFFKDVLIILGLTTLLTITVLGIWKMV